MLQVIRCAADRSYQAHRDITSRWCRSGAIAFYSFAVALSTRR
jgi:hypothetical protein